MLHISFVPVALIKNVCLFRDGLTPIKSSEEPGERPYGKKITRRDGSFEPKRTILWVKADNLTKADDLSFHK